MMADWAWSEWFDRQSELTDQVDKAVAGLSEDRTYQFRVALYSAVIEHCAEKMRMFIPDEAVQAQETRTEATGP